MPDEAPSERILIAEDDPALRQILAEVLSAHGYEVSTSPNGRHALRTLQRQRVDLVLTDLMMPGLGGEALLEQVRTTFPEIPVITMTSFGSVEGAVALTRAGAADYLTKPLDTLALLASLQRVVEESRPQREQARERRLHGKHLDGVVGRSRPMIQLFQQIERIAASPAPVLVTGETGTGKELVARALHRASGRDPFVPVNCGAIPATLLESELFGYVRGAFTGADHEKRGLFEIAEGGTLFLDEIAELPLAAQAKLLRVLQFGELRRVGEAETRQVQVRVIAATHQDLQAAAREGSFREDLYYRINVLRLEVPALRERAADIPLLAERFLADLARRTGEPPKRLSPAALAALVAYPWPGNVRELQSAIGRAALLSTGAEIGPDDLPDSVRTAAPATTTPALIGQELTLAELEREHILAVLARVGGNRSLAAKVLDISRRTLHYRLEEYGIRLEV